MLILVPILWLNYCMQIAENAQWIVYMYIISSYRGIFLQLDMTCKSFMEIVHLQSYLWNSLIKQCRSIKDIKYAYICIVGLTSNVRGVMNGFMQTALECLMKKRLNSSFIFVLHAKNYQGTGTLHFKFSTFVCIKSVVYSFMLY